MSEKATNLKNDIKKSSAESKGSMELAKQKVEQSTKNATDKLDEAASELAKSGDWAE